MSENEKIEALEKRINELEQGFLNVMEVIKIMTRVEQDRQKRAEENLKKLRALRS
jgi:hypothetical protein